ncbi:hypothetical protein LOCC1_G004834 [Lachnellula occidentalis]|uniref:Uncharacterized protein n=1 Tax=Lachnellula occidentalis TaxID=215460 RepID=A0A8H8RY38_9HELO|nr:hypothetical protein LOCC1_G004834 [Lachnellula occidentalis]
MGHLADKIACLKLKMTDSNDYHLPMVSRCNIYLPRASLRFLINTAADIQNTKQLKLRTPRFKPYSNELWRLSKARMRPSERRKSAPTARTSRKGVIKNCQAAVNASNDVQYAGMENLWSHDVMGMTLSMLARTLVLMGQLLPGHRSLDRY